ncbi:MAG: radical SAM protein [Acidimicrobiales bacterium]
MTTAPPPRRAFDVRRANFPDVMDFYAPGLKRWQTSEWVPARSRRFLAVSVTGSACALRCEHCRTKMLDDMVSVRTDQDLYALAARLQGEGCEALLVSGGSTRLGAVPLLAHLGDITRIRERLGMKVIVHSGLASSALAAGLAACGVDGVMIDVIGSDETLRDIYHLDLTVADVERSLRLLADHGLRIVPHIVLGLHYGRFLGEYRALEMLVRHRVPTLVLVVLVPLAGTPMAHLAPPPVDEVTDFLSTARLAMPKGTINLGCARPPGAMKRELDEAAIDLGLNGIAYPADGSIDYARSRGLTPRLFESCCSLAWSGMDEGDDATVRVTP